MARNPDRDLTNDRMPLGEDYLGMCHTPDVRLNTGIWPKGRTQFNRTVLVGIGYIPQFFLPDVFRENYLYMLGERYGGLL
jgi:hypothetical protein